MSKTETPLHRENMAGFLRGPDGPLPPNGGGRPVFDPETYGMLPLVRSPRSWTCIKTIVREDRKSWYPVTIRQRGFLQLLDFTRAWTGRGRVGLPKRRGPPEMGPLTRSLAGHHRWSERRSAKSDLPLHRLSLGPVIDRIAGDGL